MSTYRLGRSCIRATLCSCSVLMSELWVVHDILFLVWRLGFYQLYLQTDSLEVVRILHNVSSALKGNVVVDLLHNGWKVRVQHICRESNGVTDLLARSTRVSP
ncbi:hypothetical protein V6N11_052552 [Hibiscus sabdariffa]|uniref:RNase H type-1 domain-containing protein n=1 Tax=Hibiscus sabdariffa TaxID=183260 RepID=A0ABR2UB44_9ROSI